MKIPLTPEMVSFIVELRGIQNASRRWLLDYRKARQTLPRYLWNRGPSGFTIATAVEAEDFAARSGFPYPPELQEANHAVIVALQHMIEVAERVTKEALENVDTD